jgi:hypothetical protein
VSFRRFHRRSEDSDREEPEPLPAHPAWETALSAETEAFLEGRLVEHLVAAGRPVPAWAVLNKLAHATAQDLAALVDTNGGPRHTPDGRTPAWLAAQTSLASRLLRAAAAPDQITQLQHRRLIPLELSLIERSRTETITQRQALNALEDALDRGHPNP